jgi:crossover junction endodeoxyribonuclease RusA
MQHTVEFWLPFPPSTNRLWRSVRGRVVLSSEYKDWKRRASDAIIVLQSLGKSPVLGAYELELHLSTRFRQNRDADNRIKSVLDIAAECHLIVNDKHCRRASVEWATIDHDCLVKLTGEVAYKDQWEFANALAAQQYRKR